MAPHAKVTNAFPHWKPKARLQSTSSESETRTDLVRSSSLLMLEHTMVPSSTNVGHSETDNYMLTNEPQQLSTIDINTALKDIIDYPITSPISPLGIESVSTSLPTTTLEASDPRQPAIKPLEALWQAFSRCGSFLAADGSMGTEAPSSVECKSLNRAPPPSVSDLNSSSVAPPYVAAGVKKVREAGHLRQKKNNKGPNGRKGAVQKMLREQVVTSQFPLAALSWSPWRRVMQRKHPTTRAGTPSSRWEPRFDGHRGFRRSTPFSTENDADVEGTSAVYEVGVKVVGRCEKIPVLGSVRAAPVSAGQSWEGVLLGKAKLRCQVDRVLRRGCKVYVRRARFSAGDVGEMYRICGSEEKRTVGGDGGPSVAEAVREVRGLVTRVCDYAWRDHYDTDTRTYSHRPLVVNGVKVSD